MHHLKITDQSWRPGDPTQFTGNARLAKLGQPSDASGANTTAVWFDSSARTFWHSHAQGQTLWVVAGTAVVVTEHGERVVAGPGDVVQCPPGERHWHGATAAGPMLHLSITTGGPPHWQEEVDAPDSP